MSTRDDVLEAAQGLINGDRQQEYGTPQVNFQRIASLWSVLFPEREWAPADAALALAAVKLARGAQGFQIDTAVDLAGYAALWAELSDGVVVKAAPRQARPFDRVRVKQRATYDGGCVTPEWQWGVTGTFLEGEDTEGDSQAVVRVDGGDYAGEEFTFDVDSLEVIYDQKEAK